MEEHAINYIVLYDDPEHSLTERYHVAGWPSKYFINVQGEFMKPPKEKSRRTVTLKEVEAYLESRR
jgi:hypothetical protein